MFLIFNNIIKLDFENENIIESMIYSKSIRITEGQLRINRTANLNVELFAMRVITIHLDFYFFEA